LPEKDPDAEQYLQQTIGGNPDAMYILAQTVLVQQYALTQAQKQLADAKTQLAQVQDQPKHSTSFLGNLLGMRDDSARSSAPPPPPPPQGQYYQQQPQFVPVANSPYPPAYPPAGYPPQYAPAYGAPQQGGFLRSAMQTATGVAAGALAFEGIESLMHGFGGGGGGFESGGYGGGRPEEVVNNYYGDDSGREHESHSSDSYGGSGNDRYESRDDTKPSDISDFGNDSSSYDDASNSGGDFGDGGNDDSNS